MQLIKFVLVMLPFYVMLQGCYSSSIIREVTGNIFPYEHYFVTLKIGNPPRLYDLLIDTGSTLTWVQCNPGDVAHVKYFMGTHALYVPKWEEVGHPRCTDPICYAVQWPNIHCNNRFHHCDYTIGYVGASTTGVLVTDSYHFQYVNGTITTPRLTFGCAYYQVNTGGDHRRFDGILGLSMGIEGIPTQMHPQGVTRNVVGICLSSLGDGYMFFGDHDLIPLGVVWTPMVEVGSAIHYIIKNVDLYLDGSATGIKGLRMTLDSGTTYTYLIHEAYTAVLSWLENDIKGTELKRADDEVRGDLCWEKATNFQSTEDFKDFFKPITLSLGDQANTQFRIDPPGYLFINQYRKVCLGILHSRNLGVHGELNILGAISMHDKVMIFDNENHKIGWSSANCNEIPL